MATPRGPRGSSYNRPSAAVPRVYEKFTPSSEWKQEKESDILLIFLPEFLKQNIRVTTETGNILRVTGERPVGGNKVSRFQEDFEIPKNCIIKAIRAKFEGGILSITFPPIGNTSEKAKTSRQPDPKITPSQKQEPTSQVAKPKTSRQPDPQKQDKKEATSEAAAAAAIPPVLEEATYETTTPAALPSPESKELETSRFQTPKLTNTSNADLPKEPRKFIESSRPPLVVDDDKTPLVPTLGTAKATTDEEGEMYKKKNGFEKGAGGCIDKADREEEQDEKVSDKIVDQVDIKQAMKSLGRRINEEKELVVNMGAAVMVIVGLGAYVYHSFSSAKLAKR